MAVRNITLNVSETNDGYNSTLGCLDVMNALLNHENRAVAKPLPDVDGQTTDVLLTTEQWWSGLGSRSYDGGNVNGLLAAYFEDYAWNSSSNPILNFTFPTPGQVGKMYVTCYAGGYADRPTQVTINTTGNAASYPSGPIALTEPAPQEIELDFVADGEGNVRVEFAPGPDGNGVSRYLTSLRVVYEEGTTTQDETPTLNEDITDTNIQEGESATVGVYGLITSTVESIHIVNADETIEVAQADIAEAQTDGVFTYTVVRGADVGYNDPSYRLKVTLSSGEVVYVDNIAVEVEGGFSVQTAEGRLVTSGDVTIADGLTGGIEEGDQIKYPTETALGGALTVNANLTYTVDYSVIGGKPIGSDNFGLEVYTDSTGSDTRAWVSHSITKVARMHPNRIVLEDEGHVAEQELAEVNFSEATIDFDVVQNGLLFGTNYTVTVHMDDGSTLSYPGFVIEPEAGNAFVDVVSPLHTNKSIFNDHDVVAQTGWQIEYTDAENTTVNPNGTYTQDVDGEFQTRVYNTNTGEWSEFVTTIGTSAQMPVQTNVVPNINIIEGDSVTLNIGDYFDHETSYSVTGLVSGTGFTFDTDTGVFTGAGNVNDVEAGSYKVEFLAHNDAGSASTSITVTVLDSLSAPVADGTINPINATEHDSINVSFGQYFVGIVDEYQITGLPIGTGASFDSTTGELTGTWSFSDYEASPFDLVVTALNDAGTADQTVEVYVEEYDDNPPSGAITTTKVFSTSPAIEGSCNDDTATVEILGETLPVENNSWVLPAGIANFEEGDNAVTATFTDPNGNESQDTATIEVVINTVSLRLVDRRGRSYTNATNLTVSIRESSESEDVIYKTHDETTDDSGFMHITNAGLETGKEYFITAVTEDKQAMGVYLVTVNENN